MPWHSQIGHLTRGAITMSQNRGGKTTAKTGRTFAPEFKLKVDQLVVEQNYCVQEAAEAVNMGKSSMDKCVLQVRNELAVQQRMQPLQSHPTRTFKRTHLGDVDVFRK